MQPPVKNLSLKDFPNGDISQWFGENPALYKPFGLAYHNGIDIVRPYGELEYATENARVVAVKDDPSGFGKYIKIISDESENGVHREWTYAHNSENLVKVGDTVKEGDVIAKMGNTGFVISGSTPFWKTNPYAGTHLHFGLRLVKKLSKGGFRYTGSNIRLEVLNYENGVRGAINPVPYLRGYNAEERAKQSALVLIANLLRRLIK